MRQPVIPHLNEAEFTTIPNSEMVIATVLAGPTEAADWLKTARQPDLSENSPIPLLSFDVEGCLVAGHRWLNMICETGKPTHLHVMVDESPESVRTQVQYAEWEVQNGR